MEEGMATHSSILAWRISQTEEPGGPQPIGLQRVGQDLSDLAHRVVVNEIMYVQPLSLFLPHFKHSVVGDD